MVAGFVLANVQKLEGQFWLDKESERTNSLMDEVDDYDDNDDAIKGDD